MCIVPVASPGLAGVNSSKHPFESASSILGAETLGIPLQLFVFSLVAKASTME